MALSTYISFQGTPADLTLGGVQGTDKCSVGPEKPQFAVPGP